MPPPGARLVGLNPDGTSRWLGDAGQHVDVDHRQPGMEDFAQEVRAAQAAPVPVGVQPQARYADAPRPANQPTMMDAGSYGQSLPVEDIQSPPAGSPAAPPAMSVDPNAGRPQMSVDTSPAAMMSDPDAYELAQRQQREFEAANRAPAATVTFADSDGAAPNGPQTAINGGTYIMGGGGGPARNVEVVRGRSVTEQSGDQPIPGQAERIQGNLEEGASAERHKGKIQMAAQAEAERTLRARNDELNRMYGESVDAERGRAAMLDQARRNFDDIASRARSMTADPDRRTGGDRVIGAIAAMLGGIGSGITGGPNHAAQIVEHAIDRDVEAQRTNMSHAQHGVAAAQTAYQLAREQGASERDAERIHMAYEYQRAANEAQRLAALTGSQEAMDNANLLALRWMNTSDELLANINHLQSGRRGETTQYGTARVGGPGRARQVVPYRNPQTGQVEMRTLDQMNEHTTAVLGTAGVTPAIRQQWQLDQGYMVGGGVGGAAALDEGSATRIQRFAEHAAQYAGAMDAMGQLTRIVNASEEDLPGTGPLAGRINRYLVGEDGRRLRQQMDMTSLLAVYAASGKQVGQREMEQISNALRLVHSANPDEIRNGLRQIDSLVGAPYRELEVSLSDAEREEVSRRRARSQSMGSGGSSVRGTQIGGR